MTVKRVDPFELHPELDVEPKKKKKTLTKEKILSILRTESERIGRESVPTWGWTTNDLLEVLDNIEEELERL
jgi:hypothetical protein